jgi:SAM-dependent methyltransferase
VERGYSCRVTFRERIRTYDEQRLDGRLRDWMLRNTVLGGGWGTFVDELVATKPGALVLDLGAGEAELRARLPHARYVAIDRGIGHAGWDYSKLDVVADASAVPLADASCDVVVCKQVLEHLPQPLRAVCDMRRVLKPGGKLLLSTNQQWPQHQQPHDYFRFTSFGLRYVFERAGLRIERIEPMGGAFSVLLFQFSQILAPHIWARTAFAQRIAAFLLRPFGWLLKACMPLVTALDKLDRTKDNTLGWYVIATRPE